MPNALNLEGYVFGRLAVIGPAPHHETPKGKLHTAWQCRCECGNVVDVTTLNLRRGATRSCGCIQREFARGVVANYQHSGEENNFYRHGNSYQGGKRALAPTYQTWNSIMGRCYCKGATNYFWYGGREIEVCARWLDYNSFLADMGEKPEGTTLERIDVNQGYFKENCRWVLEKTHAKHRGGGKR